MALQAVLFDHDGTLVDSEVVHFRHWREALATEPVDLTEAIYREAFAGIPTTANAEWLVRNFPVTVDAATLVARKEAITRAMLATGAFPLVDQARAVIDAFHGRGVRMGVVTGAGPESIAATLREYGLADRLPVVVSAADVVHSKPAPDCYCLALERLGIAATDAVAFEDSETGLRAAVGAGLRCYAIRTPFTAGHDFSLATGVFPSLADATRYVLEQG